MTLNSDLIDQIVDMTHELTGGDFDSDSLVDDLTQMTRDALEALADDVMDDIRAYQERDDLYDWCDCM